MHIRARGRRGATSSADNALLTGRNCSPFLVFEVTTTSGQKRFGITSIKGRVRHVRNNVVVVVANVSERLRTSSVVFSLVRTLPKLMRNPLNVPATSHSRRQHGAAPAMLRAWARRTWYVACRCDMGI